MDALLVKIFATALTLSQVTTAPDQVKTQFDRVQDQEQVVQLLQAGCAHMRKAFDIEDLNLDDLIATAMEDPQGMTGGVAAFRGINFSDLFTAYKQFCKNEKVEKPAVDLGLVIDFYNKAAADLPDPAKLKSPKLPGATVVLDGKGARFAELFESDQRRVWVALSDIPKLVQQAFISAEDKRFYQHNGIDERSLIRAFIGNIAQSGRPQGGSTITQQVVKNLLVGEDLTYERKIREMILTARVERLLSKAEILELYLNSTYLGRGSWGVEMAARSYFGKSVKALSLGEGALLAALTKGPTYFSPDQHPDRAQERVAYVLGRMQEDGAISAADAQAGLQSDRDPHRLHQIRGATSAFISSTTSRMKPRRSPGSMLSPPIPTRSTPPSCRTCSAATEAALQEGLARFEIDGGRVSFQGAEANLANAVKRIQSDPKTAPQKQPWLQALAQARLPLYDVHWPVAVVVDKGGGKGGDGIHVGLQDGRILPLAGAGGSISRTLKLYDVVFVHLSDAKAKTATGGNPGAAASPGRCVGAGQQDRPHPGDVRRLLLSAEPAQPHHAVAAAAGLRAQAADLPGGIAERAAAQHHRARPGDHASAHRRRHQCARAGLLDAEELRSQRMGRRHAAARAGEFAQPGDSQSPGWRDRQ